jgi:hypothetical protein
MHARQSTSVYAVNQGHSALIEQNSFPGVQASGCCVPRNDRLAVECACRIAQCHGTAQYGVNCQSHVPQILCSLQASWHNHTVLLPAYAATCSSSLRQARAENLSNDTTGHSGLSNSLLALLLPTVDAAAAGGAGAPPVAAAAAAAGDGLMVMLVSDVLRSSSSLLLLLPLLLLLLLLLRLLLCGSVMMLSTA